MSSKLLTKARHGLNQRTAPHRFTPRLLALCGLPVVILLAGMSFAGGRPPRQARPLSEVLAEVEKKGVDPVCDISFDDGSWEIEGYRGKEAVELHVHPIYLSILVEHPEDPQQRPSTRSLTAREIATRLEQAGFSPILELEWDHAQWEAEAVSAEGRRHLKIAPATGEILSNQADD